MGSRKSRAISVSRRNRKGPRAQRSRSPAGQPSRRELLAGSALLGASALLPGWLTGCGLLTAVDGIKAAGQRENRTLHFDLSHVEGDRKYRLNVIGSKSHRAALRLHDDTTRARFRAQNSLLRQVPDENLTHYAESVDFPADALQHYWVTTDWEDGVEALVTSHLHVPSAAYGSLVAHKARAIAAGRATHILDPRTHAKLRYLKIASVSQSSADSTLSDLNSINTPLDAATAVVFHHPEIMNLDPAQAAKVIDVISNLKGTGTSCTGANVGVLTALACAIASQGPATTSGGWMMRVPALDAEGQPVLDSGGNPVYDNQISDASMTAATPVVQEILKEIYNDPDLAGGRFASYPGVSSVSAASSAAASSKKRSAAADSAFQVSLSHPDSSVGSNLHGLLFRDFSVTNGDTRSVSLEVENIYLRFLDAYVQFLQADRKTPIAGDDGNPMSPQHLAVIPTDGAIMGIPLLDQGTLEKTRLSFDMPAAASYANILFGTLGAGGKAVGDRDQFDIGDLTHSAMAWTLAINIGIPSFLLAVGVGLQASGLLKSITEDSDILLAVAAVLVPLFVAGEATRGTLQGSARGPILDTAKVMIAICIKSIPKLTAKLLGYATTQELIDAVPFVGWACRALGMIGGIAQLAETVGEVLSSPAVFDNTVCVAMNSTITVSHDPRDFEFPATAKLWIVRATYDGTVVREQCGQIPTTQSDPISVTFEGVPVGGTVQVDVWFLSDDNWIAGQGGTGHWEKTDQLDETGAPVEKWVPESVPNFPEQAGTVNITIRENLVPLTATTIYSHKQKLGYSAGKHGWIAAAGVSGTIADLDSTRDDALHALNAISVNQAAGSVGYAWRTGTPAIGVCAGENGTAKSLQLVQNLSLTQRPDDALRLPDCGRIDHRAIAYSIMAPLGDARKHVTVDPVYGPYPVDSQTTLPYKYFVRPVTLASLTDKTPFSASAGLSWGWFLLPSDGLAVHPTGHVISVNTANSKMEILHLPAEPVKDADATCAAMMSGRGSVDGLLQAPVAVTVAPNGAVLVLDGGNGRVQAFDAYGSVNPVFRDAGGNAASSFALHSTDATRYLDIAAEAAVGYVFVLYYTGDGTLSSDYVLDIYTKDGAYLTQTRGINAARIALDYWRNVYTLNYESIAGPSGRLEPTISQWIPSTPPGTDPNALAAVNACSK